MKKKRLFSRAAIALSVIILCAASVFGYFRRVLRPTLVSMAENAAKSEATVIINECVIEELSGEDVTYASAVKTERADDGKVLSVSVDPVVANRMKSKLSVEFARRLDELRGRVFSVPLGNVTDVVTLFGKGPDLDVRVISVGAVTTDFRNEFTTAAMNQTLHRVMLDVSVNISMYIPFSLSDVPVTTSVCVAETVIVGDVPSAYTYVIEGSSGIAGTLNDYGAAAP